MPSTPKTTLGAHGTTVERGSACLCLGDCRPICVYVCVSNAYLMRSGCLTCNMSTLGTSLFCPPDMNEQKEKLKSKRLLAWLSQKKKRGSAEASAGPSSPDKKRAKLADTMDSFLDSMPGVAPSPKVSKAKSKAGPPATPGSSKGGSPSSKVPAPAPTPGAASSSSAVAAVEGPTEDLAALLKKWA